MCDIKNIFLEIKEKENANIENISIPDLLEDIKKNTNLNHENKEQTKKIVKKLNTKKPIAKIKYLTRREAMLERVRQYKEKRRRFGLKF